MAVQSNIYTISSTRTYPSTKPIASKEHMAVWLRPLGAGSEWIQLEVFHYDLISNSAVINADYSLDLYGSIEVRVADTPNEILPQQSAISIVAGIYEEVVIVAGIEDEVITVSGMEAQILDVSSEPLRQAIIDTATDPLKQAILDAEGNATSAETSATNAEASAVASEESYQRTLLVEPLVTAEGDAQILLVQAEGDTQVARVIAEGDTQETRVIDYVDESEDFKGEAEAAGLTSRSFAVEDTDVVQWTWDSVTDSLVQNVLTGVGSSKYWAEQSRITAAGIKPQGTWDSVDCSLPPTPTGIVVGESANGYMYIVTSVTGDTTGCPQMTTGDWLIWFGDDELTNPTVEGQWHLINWSFDWAAIKNVTVSGLPNANGDDLLSTAGGDMSGDITLGNNIILMGRQSDDTARDLIGITNNDFIVGHSVVPMYLRGAAYNFENAVPRTNVAQGTAVNELTRKDYVDTFLNKSGGEMSGQLVIKTDAYSSNFSLLINEDGLSLKNFAGTNWSSITNTGVDTRSDLRLGAGSGSLTVEHEGNVAVSAAEPVNPDHLTRKDYVDAGVWRQPTLAIGSTGATDSIGNYQLSGEYSSPNGVNLWDDLPPAMGSNGAFTLTVKQTDATYSFQTLVPFDSDISYTRFLLSSVWTEWETQWSSASDGAGSGLDADLLDGKEGNDYYWSTDGASLDLNTLVTSGHYRCRTGNTNLPTGRVSGSLFVGSLNTDVATQLYSDADGASIYTRSTFDNGVSWSPWVQYGAMDWDGSTLNITL